MQMNFEAACDEKKQCLARENKLRMMLINGRSMLN